MPTRSTRSAQAHVSFSSLARRSHSRAAPRAAAVVAALVAASCAGDSGARCGRNRLVPPNGAGRARAPAPGPYCLVVEAEGVGSLNVSVNEPGRGSGDEADGPEGNSDPGAPLQYTQANNPPGGRFIDVCAAPGARRVLPSVDDSSAQIPEPDAPPPPFPIRFYDVIATPPYTVASNGWLAFLPGASLGSLTGSVPSPAAPNLVAAPYWTDLVTRGGVCYAPVGAPPNRAWVVEWEDTTEFGGGGPNAHLTFEIIVHEIRAPLAHNVIDFAYQRVDGAVRSPVGVGIENNDGTAGVTVAGPYTGGRVVRFTPSR